MLKDIAKQIKKDIKMELSDLIFKVSVRCISCQKILIIIQEGSIDFGCAYASVNQYYIDEHWKENKSASALLNKVNNIIKKYHWDKSDIQNDYFHCNFYYGICIGNNKEYIKKDIDK